MKLFSEQTIFKIHFKKYLGIFARIDFLIFREFHGHKLSRSGPYQGVDGYELSLLLSEISIPGPLF